jgi:DNA-binding MarR family transcriptional regulator
MDKDFDNSLGFVIHDVSRLLRLEFDRQAHALGLTRAQWSVLAHLQRQEGVQQVDLAHTMDIAPITLARHLDRLEQDGWLKREDDTSDRRAKRVYLTAKAAPMIKSLKQVGKKVRKKALLGIDEHEFNTFMELLFRMRGNLCGGNNNKLSGRQR